MSRPKVLGLIIIGLILIAAAFWAGRETPVAEDPAPTTQSDTATTEESGTPAPEPAQEAGETGTQPTEDSGDSSAAAPAADIPPEAVPSENWTCTQWDGETCLQWTIRRGTAGE